MDFTGGPSFPSLGGGRFIGQEAQLICLFALQFYYLILDVGSGGGLLFGHGLQVGWALGRRVDYQNSPELDVKYVPMLSRKPRIGANMVANFKNYFSKQMKDGYHRQSIWMRVTWFEDQK